MIHRTTSRKNGQSTITAKDRSVTSFGRGKNGDTSDSDVAQIRATYCGNTAPTRTTVEPSTIVPMTSKETLIKLSDVTRFHKDLRPKHEFSYHNIIYIGNQ